MTGKQVVVIGQSNLLGKAMAIAAINRGGTVFSANSSTPNHSLVSACQASDIIITCT
jgi:5,10-methylene-tetrahydrofolate dehydrogenase/methenyl tetrahydrofolate cyclohydrolase